jgi:hypothetical protein
MENNENIPAEIADGDKYTIVTMFEKISHNGEFPTKINDIFGVMA